MGGLSVSGISAELATLPTWPTKASMRQCRDTPRLPLGGRWNIVRGAGRSRGRGDWITRVSRWDVCAGRRRAVSCQPKGNATMPDDTDNADPPGGTLALGGDLT